MKLTLKKVRQGYYTVIQTGHSIVKVEGGWVVSHPNYDDNEQPFIHKTKKSAFAIVCDMMVD